MIESGLKSGTGTDKGVSNTWACRTGVCVLGSKDKLAYPIIWLDMDDFFNLTGTDFAVLEEEVKIARDRVALAHKDADFRDR